MSESQQEISKLEQEAKNLVNNLRELHEAVGSYNEAKDELRITNSNLLAFIGSTQELAKESHHIIEAVNKIGSGKIFIRLGEVEKGIKRNFIFTASALAIIIIMQIVVLILK